MNTSTKETKKSDYKTYTLCCAGIILLSELASSFWQFPELYTALITITFFPCFLLSLFLWLNASEKERDTPFIGY